MPVQRYRECHVTVESGAARQLVTFSCAAKREVTKEKAALVRRHWRGGPALLGKARRDAELARWCLERYAAGPHRWCDMQCSRGSHSPPRAPHREITMHR